MVEFKTQEEQNKYVDALKKLMQNKTTGLVWNGNA